MKKLIFFFVAVMAVFFAVSCSKDDGGSDDKQSSFPTMENLDGTTWNSPALQGKDGKFDCVGFKGNRMVWAKTVGYAFGSFHYGTYTINNGTLQVVEDGTTDRYTLYLVLSKYRSGNVYLEIKGDQSLAGKSPMGTYGPLELPILNNVDK